MTNEQLDKQLDNSRFLKMQNQNTGAASNFEQHQVFVLTASVFF